MGAQSELSAERIRALAIQTLPQANPFDTLYSFTDVQLRQFASAIVASVPDVAPTFMGEPVLPTRWAAVQLQRDTQGMCIVSLRVGGKWVPVIRDSGDVISHFCEPSGVAAAVNAALGSAA
jgi:hypothetical protein